MVETRKSSISRSEVFERPSSKKDILEQRQVLYIDNFYDIASAHETRKQDEAVVIGPDVDIIPSETIRDRGFYSAQNFGKRGPLVLLDTFQHSKTRQAQEDSLRRSGFHFLGARIDASKDYKHKRDQHYVGWLWFDPKGTAHVVNPSRVIEGVRLFMHGMKTGSIEDMATYDKAYSASDSHLRSVVVSVPSRSEGKREKIILEHLTDPDDSKKSVETTYFKTRHMCPIKQWDFTFRFHDLTTYCAHDACAIYKRAADVARLKTSGKRIIEQPLPIFFSEPMLRLHLSLIHDTMKVDKVFSQDGSVKFVYRPLSFPEIDAVEMDSWLKYGNKKTFYVGAQTKGYKKMSDYNWQKSAPGLIF